MYIRCKTIVKETWYGPRDGLGHGLGQRDKAWLDGVVLMSKAWYKTK
ncbi:hypothetical protein Tco_1520270, partial [Tanacetum coccineum]